MTMSEGLAKLDLFAVDVGSAARNGVEIWANATMHGEVDATGMSILYDPGGFFWFLNFVHFNYANSTQRLPS